LETGCTHWKRTLPDPAFEEKMAALCAGPSMKAGKYAGAKYLDEGRLEIRSWTNVTLAGAQTEEHRTQ